MNPHFFTAPFFDWRDRRSDRETQTLWIPGVLHGRMTKGGNASSHSFSIRCGSQPPPLRGTSFRRKEGECRLSYSKAFSPHRHFERKREIFFVRGQEKL